MAQDVQGWPCGAGGLVRRRGRCPALALQALWFPPPRAFRLRVRRAADGLLHADANGPIEVRMLLADIIR